MNLKLTALFMAIILSVAGLGTAALTSVSLERLIIGTVTNDTNTNALIKFQAGSGYEDVVAETTTGEVTFDLNKLFTKNGNESGLNPNSTFTFGSANSSNYVFAITNNSDTTIVVRLENASTGFTLLSSPASIGTGQTGYFAFQLITGNQDSTVTGTLKIRNN